MDNHHFQQAFIVYNSKVSLHHSITAESALTSPSSERELSSKIDENVFKSLFRAANKAQLLSVSASYAASWLSVVLPWDLGLHLESNEFQTAKGIKKSTHQQVSVKNTL